MANINLDQSVIDRLLGLALSADPDEVKAFEQNCLKYIPEIITALQSIKEDGSAKHAYMLPKCFAILKEYSYENAENTKDIVQRGVISLVFALIRLHGDDTDVFVHACGLLVNLSVLPENRSLIVNAGAVPILMKMMKQHPTHTDVQKMGSMMVRNICCDSLEYQELIMQENAIPFLIETSIRHLQKWDVLEQSIAALSHVTIYEPARKIFADNGGIPLMVAIAKAPKIELQAISTYSKVAGILVNLSLSPSLQGILAEGECLAWIREAMLSPNIDALVVERILLSIGNIACNESLRMILVQNGAIVAVLRIISDPMTTRNTVRIAMWSLVNLIINSDLAFQTLLANDGTERLINVMQTYLDEPETVQHCAKVTLALTREAGVFSKEMAEEGMAVFLSALNVHSKSPELMKELCSLLVNITRDVDTHKIFHMEEGIGTIAEVLELHHVHAEVFGYCCRILANVIIEKELQNECLERRIPRLIVEGMRTNPSAEDVQIKGCQLIAILATQNAPIQDHFAKLSLVKVIGANFRVNSDNENILKYYFSVLLNLSMSDNTHGAIVTEGGFDLIYEGMHKHTGLSEIQTSCIRILGNIVGNDAMGEVFTSDILQLVINVMITHITNRDIVIVCCWILEEITNQDSKMDIVEDVQGIKAIRLALVQHTEDSEVLKRGLEVFINYSCSPFLKHRMLLNNETLVIILNMLTECPPTTQELCCIILGNMAVTSPAFIRENAVAQRVTMALATHPSDVALQIEGLSCLCKCATVTGDLSSLEPVGGVEVLSHLLRVPNLSPNLKLALYRAVQALAQISAAVHRLSESGTIDVLIADLSVVNETVLLESGILALAHAVLWMEEDSLYPMVGRLTGVVLELIASVRDAFLAAGLFLLVGNAFSRGGVLPSVLAENGITNSVLGCHERCSQCKTPNDVNILRLLCGYSLSAILVVNDTTQKQVLRSKRTTDLVWHAAQDLVQSVDLQKQYVIKTNQLNLCRQALDILLNNQMNFEGEVEIDESRPASVQPAMRQFDSRKESKQHRVPTRTAIVGDTDLPGPRIPTAPDTFSQAKVSPYPVRMMKSTDSAQLDDAMRAALAALSSHPPKNQVVLATGGTLDPRPEEIKENDKMVFEALERERKAQRQSWVDYMKALRREKAMWEEQEEFQRSQLESDEYEARRLLSVRFVQHQKAVTMRRRDSIPLTQKVFKSMENAAAGHTVELAVGTEYLRSVAEDPLPPRPLPPKPPGNVASSRPASSSESGLVKIPSIVAGEIPAAGVRRSDFVPIRPKFIPKVNQLVGWESLAAQHQQHKNDSAIASSALDPMLMEADGIRSWQERGELIKFGVNPDTVSADPALSSPKYMMGATTGGAANPSPFHQTSSSLPRYIYMRNNANNGANMSTMGRSYDLVRPVNLPNSTLPTSPTRRPFI